MFKYRRVQEPSTKSFPRWKPWKKTARDSQTHAKRSNEEVEEPCTEPSRRCNDLFQRTLKREFSPKPISMNEENYASSRTQYHQSHPRHSATCSWKSARKIVVATRVAQIQHAGHKHADQGWLGLQACRWHRLGPLPVRMSSVVELLRTHGHPTLPTLHRSQSPEFSKRICALNLDLRTRSTRSTRTLDKNAQPLP